MDSVRWIKFSLFEQLSHIGSEITRARIWDEKKDIQTRNRCIERAFELIDLTRDDHRWRKRLKELCRFREFLADHYADSKCYQVTLRGLEQYCTDFALALRRHL